jgi:hypothetical protein
MVDVSAGLWREQERLVFVLCGTRFRFLSRFGPYFLCVLTALAISRSQPAPVSLVHAQGLSCGIFMASFLSHYASSVTLKPASLQPLPLKHAIINLIYPTFRGHSATSYGMTERFHWMTARKLPQRLQGNCSTSRIPSRNTVQRRNVRRSVLGSPERKSG